MHPGVALLVMSRAPVPKINTQGHRTLLRRTSQAGPTMRSPAHPPGQAHADQGSQRRLYQMTSNTVPPANTAVPKTCLALDMMRTHHLTTTVTVPSSAQRSCFHPFALAGPMQTQENITQHSSPRKASTTLHHGPGIQPVDKIVPSYLKSYGCAFYAQRMPYLAWEKQINGKAGPCDCDLLNGRHNCWHGNREPTWAAKPHEC